MKVIKYLPILAICMMTTGCNSSKQQTLTSGIDLANLDTLALSGADFYQYACGGWMKNHPLFTFRFFRYVGRKQSGTTSRTY